MGIGGHFTLGYRGHSTLEYWGTFYTWVSGDILHLGIGGHFAPGCWGTVMSTKGESLHVYIAGKVQSVWIEFTLLTKFSNRKE